MFSWATAVLRSLSRFHRDVSGNIVIMGAITLPVVLMATAFAVDEGGLYYERREAQAMADLAAISAAANPANAEAAALTVFRNNGFREIVGESRRGQIDYQMARGRVHVEQGRYEADGTRAVDVRFVVERRPFNAVRVTFRKTGTLYFAKVFNFEPPQIAVSSVASAPAQAAFSVGSRLASLNDGLLNEVLGGLLGTTVSLEVMDYEALLDADVDVLKFIDALHVELGVTAATYDEVLQSSATIGQIARALASIDGVSSTARLALQAIAANQSNPPLSLPLSHLFNLGPAGQVALGNHGAGFGAAASIMDILTAGAAIANNGKQLTLDVGGTLPGLAAVTLAIAVGEPPQFKPWFAMGESGDIVRTAQTRLKLVVDIGKSGTLLAVRLPIHLELAYAEAELTKVSCPTGRPESLDVEISARPGVAELRIAEASNSGFADFTRDLSFKDAKLAEVKVLLSLLSVKGSARVDVANLQPQTLEFDHEDISDRAIKTVSTRDVTQSLTQSLLNGLTLDINLLGLPINLDSLLASVRPALLAALNPVTASVDTLLYNVLSTLGVRIGEADIRVTAASCGRSVLVQ